MDSEAQKRATAKYNLTHYDMCRFRVPFGYLEVIRQYAKELGMSLNAFIVEAINMRIQSLQNGASTSNKSLCSIHSSNFRRTETIVSDLPWLEDEYKLPWED